MLTSVALILLLGILMGEIFNKLGLPKLIGMIITGIVLGPHVMNLLDDKILMISPELRKIALVIILTRAGLSLDLDELKKVGRPAILMCFIPAIFEIGAFILLGPSLLGITVLDAAIIGAVIAAVSPAIIVPRMIKLIEEGRGKKNSIPQLIMAGASVDDIFVIVLFTAFTDMAKGEGISAMTILEIPISIILGIGIGVIVGIILLKIFQRIHMRDTIKIIIILGISFLLITVEDILAGILPISSLLSIMSIGIIILRKNKPLASRISTKYSKLWIVGEIVLFVLVGATVDINYVISTGMASVILILIGLLFRMVGVFICLLKTSLSKKERLFCSIAYLPKATVQAAIGGIPLAMGLGCGEIVLAVAVLAILITAPLGAMGIDFTYKKLL